MEKKESNDTIFKRNFLRYLKAKIPNFQFNKHVFTCPNCKNALPSTLFVPGADKLYCNACKYKDKLIHVVYLLEQDKAEWSIASIAEYLFSEWKVKIPELNHSFYLECYEKWHWDLVPLLPNKKIPFEKDWLNKEYKNKLEWEKWITDNFNIGVKTGHKSNITVLDIDTKEIPDILKGVHTIRQDTNRGYHFIFAYDPEIPTTKIEEFKIDILNDGKQFVVYPSKVDGIDRNWNFKNPNIDLPKIPENIKKWILENVNQNGTKKVSENPEEEQNQKLIEDIKNESLGDFEGVLEGNRNNTLIKMGGILRKRLNFEQTSYVVKFFNKNFIKPSLPENEVYALLGSIDKYTFSDERDLAMKILAYLKYAEEGTSRDIREAIKEEKANVDKALNYLLKEQYIVKRNRMFHLVKKMVWREDLPALNNQVPFKIPYFDDIALFNWGDLILLGAPTGHGKTTIAMNIIKRFQEEKIKCHYVCLESGSRFVKTGCALGLSPELGHYKYVIETDPAKIQIEENSVTIIDWLLIQDKAQTDMVMQYFSEQLVRTNSILIIFMQLKEDGNWFAPNMVKQFPALAARYVYSEDEQGNADGIFGTWEVDKIREAKRHCKGGKIHCKYNPDDKTLVRLDEIQDDSNASSGELKLSKPKTVEIEEIQ